jgi:hypothetical protein
VKVVLKVTVYDRIYADIQKAQRERREVDYVVVSREEYAELRLDDRSYGALESPYSLFVANPAEAVKAMDAKYTVYEFRRTAPRTSPSDYEVIRSPSHETFMGKPLVVVPKEYMPR